PGPTQHKVTVGQARPGVVEARMFKTVDISMSAGKRPNAMTTRCGHGLAGMSWTGERVSCLPVDRRRDDMGASVQTWPSLVVEEWTATRDTLHMWTQIVGKIRMGHMPLINHWWQVTLYMSARGLTTGAIPYRDAVFDIEFDFVDSLLAI